MGTTLKIPDGYGGYVGDRCPMRGGPGAHCAYARAADVVVEWYDFGPEAPYESVNLIIFDRPEQRRLAQLLCDPDWTSPHDIAGLLASRFKTYFDVKAFAEANNVPFHASHHFDP